MTSSERARQLWADIHDLIDSDDIEDEILKYADEIRRQCVMMAKLHLVCKSGFSSLEAAIMGNEAETRINEHGAIKLATEISKIYEDWIDSTSSFPYGSDVHVKQSKLITDHDRAIRQECANIAETIVSESLYDGAGYYQVDIPFMKAAITGKDVNL